MDIDIFNEADVSFYFDLNIENVCVNAKIAEWLQNLNYLMVAFQECYPSTLKHSRF